MRLMALCLCGLRGGGVPAILCLTRSPHPLWLCGAKEGVPPVLCLTRSYPPLHSSPPCFARPSPPPAPSPNAGILNNDIKWNFSKFLVDKEGKVVGR